MTSASLHLTTTSILLRSPSHSSSPSPSPASTPLPALQTDLSSSSSSASGSCLDLRPSSAPSSRRIRFAPLPDPHRDSPLDLSPSDDLQLDSKPVPQTLPVPNDLPDGIVALSPTVSPVSTLSSTRSTPTIRVSPNTSRRGTQRSTMKFLRPFLFFRPRPLPSPSSPTQSDPLPDSPHVSRSTASLPNTPSLQPTKLSRFSTEDLFAFGAKPLFRSRSGSTSSTRSVRPSSPRPKSSDPPISPHRPPSTDSQPSLSSGNGKGDSSSSHSHGATTSVNSSPKRRRASSALTLGAGGGRHASSAKLLSNDSRPSTAPSSPVTVPKKHVKLLNGRVYGAKRYAAQTLANPFANVRDEPEFVEWGYGGMGSVHASAGIANDVWKGLQRSERGGALLAGSSFGPSTHPTAGAVVVGGGRGSGASATSPVARRKMSGESPECGMGNVGAGGDEDDGSGMGWVRRRRAEKEARARLEQEAKELDKKAQEGRKSGESVDASMYASTASTTTSLTACTSTDLTTPATSPLTSRSPSMVNLNITSSPLEPGESRESHAPVHLTSTPTEEHAHHVLTAVRLSPNISTSSHKHSQSVTHGRSPSLPSTLSTVDNRMHEQVAPPSPVDTVLTSANSLGDDEALSQGSDEEVDDDEVDEVQDTGRKTALGAGVEKISRHVDVEAR